MFEPYLRTYISKAFSAAAVVVQWIYVPYDEISEKQNVLRSADMITLCLNFDALYPDVLNDVASEKIKFDKVERDAVHRCKNLYSLIKANTKSKIIWFGFEDYYIQHDIICGNVPMADGVDRINQTVNNALIGDVYIDLKRLIAKIGIHNSYSPKGKYRWNAPYSKALVERMADEVYKQYLIYTGKTKKCIVLDCDNVLWGGVLSEDGVENIHLGNSGLGREYQDFQRFLLNLYYHGVILTVCSKNDKDDVLRVFREHSGMILREEHIACFKTNWEDKPSNIKTIAEELNIGTDSMVFVDDSQFEEEMVKSFLPDVMTIQYDREQMYNKFSCFNLKKEIDFSNIKQRNNTYRTNQQRGELKKLCNSYDEYINALDVKIDIHPMTPAEYGRVAELTQRTNRCTNGKRYTVSEIKTRKTVPKVHFYSVAVSDRFSDLGIVGAMEVEDDILKLFSLSCRALSRKVENEMLHYISDKYNLRSIEFKSSEKNESLYNFLKESFPNVCLINLERNK